MYIYIYIYIYVYVCVWTVAELTLLIDLFRISVCVVF